MRIRFDFEIENHIVKHSEERSKWKDFIDDDDDGSGGGGGGSRKDKYKFTHWK